MVKSVGWYGVALALSIWAFADYGLVYVYLSRCTWPEYKSNELRALVISDPHLLGRRKGMWIDRVRRERQMESVFRTSVQLFQPEVVILMGDLFDEGKWAKKPEWDSTIERFHRIFAMPEGVPMIPIIGNHDIGFHEMARPFLVQRFEEAFGPAVNMRVVKNITFVSVNSMAFVDNCQMCTTARNRLTNITSQLNAMPKRKKPMQKKGSKGIDLSSERPILLSHFPLYRASEGMCVQQDSPSITAEHMLYEKQIAWAMGAPESERQAIMGIRPPKSYTSPPRNKAGFDVLKMDVTKHLTKVLKPRFVFSGHTHNHCTFVQPGCHTPELTVSTFNWRNRHDPSFVLSVIAPQKDRDPKERVNIGGKRQSSTIDDTADVESLLQAHIDKTVAGNDVLQRVEGLDEFYFGAGGVRSVRCKAPDENTVYLLYATAVCILVLSLVEMYCFSVYGAMRRALWCDVIVEEIRESSGGCCNSPAAPKED